MYKKITHLERLSFEVFYVFTRFFGTAHWFNGIDVQPKPEDQKGRDPLSGDQREVLVYQGKNGPFQQHLRVRFYYHADYGWEPGKVTLVCNNEGDQFTYSFQVALDLQRDYVFAPEGTDITQFCQLSSEEQRDVLRAMQPS